MKNFTLRVLLAALLVSGTGCSGAASDGEGYRIHLDVPGTKVFREGVLLGEVPVEVSAAHLSELGLKGPVGFDGWGEGLFFGTEDEFERRIMFQVPESEAHKYLTIETPWGRRTKLNGGLPGSAGGFTSNPFLSVGADGLRLEINFPSRVSRSDKQISVNLRLSNVGQSEYVGFRPQVKLLWGTFNTPWRLRSHRVMNVGPEWEKIAPGEVLEVNFSIPAPVVAEDYSVFGLFTLFESEEDGAYLAGDGSVYSNSKYLCVR